MKTTDTLNPDTLKVVLEQIDRSIEEHKREIARLEKAKQELLQTDFGQSAVKKERRKRLPAGVPRRLALKAFEMGKVLTIRELTDCIEQDSGHRLGDSTIRRVVDKLQEEGIITLREDGKWILSKKEEIGNDSPI